VLWLSECPYTGSGFGKTTYYLIKELKSQGFKVVSSCFATPLYLEYEGIPILPFPREMNSLPKLLEVVTRRYGKPDVLVMFGSPWTVPWTSVLTQVDAVKRRVKIIGYYVHEAHHIPTAIKWWFGRAHLVATPTKYVAKVLRFQSERIHVVPHGVNPGLWNPARYNPPREDVIGMIAKNHPRKRWDMWLATLAFLRKARRNVRGLAFTSVRGYWHLDKLTASVSEFLRVDIPITILDEYDAQTGIPENAQVEVVSKMKIHLLISMGEAWGLPVTETLALGIPNIVVDYPAIREWCSSACIYIPAEGLYWSIDGLLHPVPEIGAILDKVTEVLDHYPEYRDKAEKASRWIRKQLTWKQAGKEMIRAIDKVMNLGDELVTDVDPILRKIKVNKS